jgi:hypothetical protein
VDSHERRSLAPEVRREPWWIGLACWVLQDGNYTDFVTGERRQFAVEFGYARTKRLEPSIHHAEPRCRYSGRDTTYEVAGPLLRSATEPMKDAFELDFGLRAYAEWMVLDDLQPPAAGQWLSGEVTLSVDYFAHMDDLAQRPGMPALIYTWTIEEIQLDTTPRVRVETVTLSTSAATGDPSSYGTLLGRAGKPSPGLGCGTTTAMSGHLRIAGRRLRADSGRTEDLGFD